MLEQAAEDRVRDIRRGERGRRVEVPSVEVSPGHTQGLRVGGSPGSAGLLGRLSSFLDTHCSQTPVHHCGFQTEQCGLSGPASDLHPQVPPGCVPGLSGL